MANHKAAKQILTPKAAKLKYGTLSGTVKNSSGVGLVRKVFAYKVGAANILAGETISTVTTGAYSLSVLAGSNDYFRIIAIGENGENSKIYEKVAAY